MQDSTIYFAYPGELDTQTGGYHYDRRLVAGLRELGYRVELLSLPHCLPTLSNDADEEVRAVLAALPDQALVIIDGLAFGVLDKHALEESERLRLVALCHHPLALETGLDSDARARLLASEQRALACARAVLVTSEHTGQVLQQQFGVAVSSLAVALPGTDPVSFADCRGEPVRLLSVGSLTRRKGHDLLIAALAELQFLPWQARIVGAGEFDPEWSARLKKEVEERGLSDRICFTGAVEDTLAEYLQADLFVLPSRYEGYGMVFAEALAAGLPVIAARSGAVPSVVPDSAGVLVQPDDVIELTAVLRQLLSDQEYRQRLQAGARQAARSLPTWADTARVVHEKLQTVEVQ